MTHTSIDLHEYVAVVRQQLAQLILEIFIIRLALAVAGIVPVPR